MKILVTGGAGFIGSALIRYLIENTSAEVVNLDKLTYAANPASLAACAANTRYVFERVDICDAGAVRRVLLEHRPDALLHLAAESHVDRSIDGPAPFIETNINGTFTLLEEARAWWQALDEPHRRAFRFLHVSTDEVFGDLGNTGARFTETSRYEPSSPYSASKAASDHLARAWHRTFGMPVLVTNSSNNYGPYQFPEKLIPVTILNALQGRSLPVYGRGDQVRDWLHVDDHVRALWEVLQRGEAGRTYNIGGCSEMRNLEVVRAVCASLEELAPRRPRGVHRYEDLIAFVPDRPGHDVRYAIDTGRIERELGWRPAETFFSGLRRTVQWYLENEPWWRGAQDCSRRRIGRGNLAG